MRYLGIDYGEKRIGLAVSDHDGKIAFPRKVVSRLAEVIEFIQNEDVGQVVIGLPLAANGGKTEATTAVTTFADELGRAVELPIVFENEVFTSKIAERTSARERADAAAAALILQSFLDKQVK